MIKIWKGPEMEGPNKGIVTLFVMTRKITYKYFNTIQAFIKKHNIKRVYFGAGKLDVYQDISGIVKFIKSEGVKVVIEVSYKHFIKNRYDYSQFDEVILRCDFEHKHLDNLLPKYEQGNTVIMFSNDKHITNLDTLSNNIYEGVDEILYNKK